MKLQRKLTSREWAENVALGPGVRMFRGKKTLFWNGEELWEGGLYGHPIIYNKEERDSWEVIIVLPGVEIIPAYIFLCLNVETVIMADTVKRIEEFAFDSCSSLKFVKLSRSLEYIGFAAFRHCTSLTSIFIPPSCQEIRTSAFYDCKKLIILSIPQYTQLGEDVIARTALIQASHFEEDEYKNHEQVNEWIKNINSYYEEYALHKACSAFNPQAESIYAIVKRVGIQAFQEPNSIGITPAQYLDANYFAQVDQTKIINRYILDLMGEIV